MAHVRHAKGGAGASRTVRCEPSARFEPSACFVFDFPTTDAALARVGDNLNIWFAHGANLQMVGFYQQYNGENPPALSIDGPHVAADFFAAMNEPNLWAMTCM